MYWHEATFSCPFLSWQFKIPSKIKHFTSIIHQKTTTLSNIKWVRFECWFIGSIQEFTSYLPHLLISIRDIFCIYLILYRQNRMEKLLKDHHQWDWIKKIPIFTEMNNFPSKVIPYTKFKKKKTTTPVFSQTVPLCEEQVSLLRILISIEPNKYFGFINDFSSIFLLNAHSRLFRVKRRRNLFSSVQFTQLIEI